MDDLEGWGSAKNAVVRFQGVPIMYTPSWTFPMDERRKSGFLSPRWRHTNRGGLDFSVPYYWNIAPNRDVTLTPRVIAKRGVHLDGNLRYLDTDDYGELGASFLPDDDLKTANRYKLNFIHLGQYQTNLSHPLKYEINYTTISDKSYLTDFENNLRNSSTDTLEQTAKLSYTDDQWSVSALLLDHYTIENIATIDEPYRKLPQVDMFWSNIKRDNQLNYDIAGQFVHFDHLATSKPAAERYWVKPKVSYNYTLFNDSVFIKPGISVAHSHYELENGSSSLTIPYSTLEAGFFMERNNNSSFNSLGNYLQTLNPKVTFSHIPANKNSGQNFDTPTESGNSKIDLSELNGKDSAPYTKQVTFNIESDFFREYDEKKMISTSLEQTHYILDSSDGRDWSNLVGTINTDFSYHHTGLELNWDPYDNWNDTIDANYQFDNGIQLVNVGYIYERSTKQQIDLSAALSLTPHWSIVGRYNHELISSNQHRLENLLGIKYDTCCWSARFTHSDYFTGNTDQYDATWLIILELKGLGNIGKLDSLNTLLMDSIKGYKPEE